MAFCRWVSFFLLFLICFYPRFHRWVDNSLVLLFFDVGQGDATLVRFPTGETWLIDAGGGYDTWSVGDHVLFPELARLGILRLDASVLSHPDQDHGFGFLALWKKIPSRVFWYRDLPSPKPLLTALRAGAKDQSIELRGVSKLTGFSVGDVHGTFLTPPASAGSSNEQLLGLYLRRGKCGALWLGDAPGIQERKVIPSLLPGPIEVLKVSHHGSRSSSDPTFLTRIRPRWAVISAGKANPYGHPHRGTLERLHQLQAQVQRTDFHGFTEFKLTAGGEIFCRDRFGFCGYARCP